MVDRQRFHDFLPHLVLALGVAIVASAPLAAQTTARIIDGYSGLILICNPAVAQAWGIPTCSSIATDFKTRSTAVKIRHFVGTPGQVDSQPEHATPDGAIETLRSLRLLIWFEPLTRVEKGWNIRLRAYEELPGVGGQRLWRNVFVQGGILDAGKEAQQASRMAPALLEGFFSYVSRQKP
jgi:hypothetical protein